MPTIKINDQATLVSDGDTTLLSVMEHAGMEVEYHCRDGHCGACRCQLSKGDVEYVGFAMAYTQENEILPCISKPLNDVELKGVRYSRKKQSA